MEEEFVDPHLHLWDTKTDRETGMPVHSARVLGPPARLHPIYSHQDYTADMAASQRVKLTAAVHVEAIPNNDIAEATWVAHHVKDAGIPFAIVCHMDLSNPRAADELAAIRSEASASCRLVRGVRMILNWEPTWPRVDRGDYLTSEDFERGYASLATHNLSFDLQVNPYQLRDAARLATAYPSVPVIINHMGCLSLPGTAAADAMADEAAAKAIDQWREGMRAMKEAGSHVYVKLSMLCYTDPNWDDVDNSIVTPFVQEVLDLFGTDHCMFASNYPVDKADGWSPQRLFNGFFALCNKLQLTQEQRHNLFAATARKAYRLPA